MDRERAIGGRWVPASPDGGAGAGATPAAAAVLAWEDDPGPPGAAPAPEPVRRPVPELAHPRLPVGVRGRRPDTAQAPGTEPFRWWAAAEALARGRDLWARLLPDDTAWVADVGEVLIADLDAGPPELNAYYDRGGLKFFHDTVAGTTVYSGESPDVVCHELGHAVLDALRPQLWDVAATEPAAFHESFGDISALLSALELPSLRQAMLDETAGKPWRSSRVSRLAEQLGWALRSIKPGSAEDNGLRDAANEWFWRDPSMLPTTGPASQLSTEPHFFSRVFTGAFLKALAGMYALRQDAGEAGLHETAADAAALLVDAVRTAPVVPGYFSQVAAGMIAADQRRNEGAHVEALRFAFVRHGVLALSSANAAVAEPPAHRGIAPDGEPGAAPALGEMRLEGAGLGLPEGLVVRAAAHPRRLGIAGAAPDVGAAQVADADRAAAVFAEDLFQSGRVDAGAAGDAPVLTAPLAYKTHVLEPAETGHALRRCRFDCGMHL